MNPSSATEVAVMEISIHGKQTYYTSCIQNVLFGDQVLAHYQLKKMLTKRYQEWGTGLPLPPSHTSLVVTSLVQSALYSKMVSPAILLHISWHCNQELGWMWDARVRGKVGKSGGVHNRGPVMGTLYCGNS